MTIFSSTRESLYCQIGGIEVFEFENLVSSPGSFLCSQSISYAYFIISSRVKGRYQISLCDLCCTMLERDFTWGPLLLQNPFIGLKKERKKKKIQPSISDLHICLGASTF